MNSQVTAQRASRVGANAPAFAAIAVFVALVDVLAMAG